MSKIAVVTSKKYKSSSTFKKFISLLENSNKDFKVYFLNEIDNQSYTNIKLNLVVGIGGDGTALKAMKLGWLTNSAVVNLGSGRIGYLVNKIDQLNLNEIIELKTSEFKSRKPIIQNNDMKNPSFNEVVIIKNAPTNLLDLEILTSEQEVKLRADGIIISTSMGSTAYNYSAGGPIVQTSNEVIILTPISPFTKFPRSIVLDGAAKLKVKIKKDQDVSIQFDGVESFNETLKENAEFNYELSSKKLKLLNEKDEPKLTNFLNQILR